MDSFRMRVEQIRAPSVGCRMVPSRRSPGAVTGIGTDIASSARYVKALVVVQVGPLLLMYRMCRGRFVRRLCALRLGDTQVCDGEVAVQ